MIDRTIDAARQGGEDTGPKRAEAAHEMTYEQAVEYHAKFAWRALPTKSDQARAACIREVEHLRAKMATDCELAQREISAWRSAFQGADKLLTAFHAALPGIIRCSDGDLATCTNDPPGYWAPCCRVRRRCVAAGLLPTVAQQDCDDPA